MRATLIVAVAAALVCCCFITAATALPVQPQDPIIGIVSTPNVDCFAFTTPPPDIKDKVVGCTESYYVRWLEASGIRVVNYPWNVTGAEREKLLSSVNGLLFPGGGLGGAPLNEYLGFAEYVLDYSLAQNAAGDPFFVWGTCQGFQVLAAASAKNVSVITSGQYPGMYPLMMSLNFTSYQPKSKLMGIDATRRDPIVLHDLIDAPTTLNWHHSGINTQTTTGVNANFHNIFKVISTNADPITGAEFYSAYEAPDANIFAVQFHPERPPYEFSNDLISHKIETVTVSQYLSRFVAQHLRLNNHSFSGGAAEAEKYMIEKTRAAIVDVGLGSMVYWFV